MVVFEKIRWKNLLSTGNIFTEIDFEKDSSTLIVGKNGSGKSTLLDALTFALFGKPFRGITKPGLINTINQKDCCVEIEFRIGKKNYKVIRGIKPNIFEIYVDGDKLKQDAKAKDYQDQLEKLILKMNFKTFTQIVVLGSSSFVPFMQLPAAERRAIIDDLLDIQIFSSMNTIAKQRLVSIKDDIQSIKHETDVIEVKISSIEKLLAEIRSNNSAKVEKYQEEIENNQKRMNILMESSEQLEEDIEQLNSSVSDYDKIQKTIKSLTTLEIKIDSNIKKAEKDRSFYTDFDDCPTCQQPIEKNFKDTKSKEKTVKIDEYTKGLSELRKQLQSAQDRLVEITDITKQITALNTEYARNNTTILEINKYIKKLKNDIKAIEDDHDRVTTETIKLNELISEKRKNETRKEQEIKNKHYYDIAATLLKDSGIKTKIIKQYLPIINKMVNKYLSSMDFFVNFVLDEEFKETLKSRHRDDFAYENFSEGEKQKIDLSLLFTWRAVAKIKNSVSTNLLILDEVFDSSLDNDSTEGLFKILNTLGAETNLFVISHRGDILMDKFKTVVRFEKTGNYSRIV